MHQCGALLCHRCTSEAQEDQQRLVKLIFNGYKFLLASVFFPFSIANQLANEPANQKLLASQPASQPIKRSVNWLVDQSIHRLTVRLLENQILIRVSWVTVNNSVRQKEDGQTHVDSQEKHGKSVIQSFSTIEIEHTCLR